MTYLETLTPEDLITQGGKEFLVARNAEGQSRRLRLDRLATIRAIGPMPAIWLDLYPRTRGYAHLLGRYMSRGTFENVPWLQSP
ncbi:MAG TPA: hypothetical protein VNI53_05615 [Gammaproteobacteria bacterium]|nr:hypothetical protein [Gammaproteobacteria bacterium]